MSPRQDILFYSSVHPSRRQYALSQQQLKMSTSRNHLLLHIILIVTLSAALAHPLLRYGEDHRFKGVPIRDSYNDRVGKRDEFTSKSWGAGGMPFSVLYMYPHSLKAASAAVHSHPAPAAYIEETPKPQALTAPKEAVAAREHHAKSVPHVRAPIPQYRPTVRRPYSVIPQLFVSYGWGPLGK